MNCTCVYIEVQAPSMFSLCVAIKQSVTNNFDIKSVSEVVRIYLPR